MNDLLLLRDSVFILGGIGLLAASILFIAAKKFKVHENPKIDEVEDVLPAANCGGCGFPGCRPFAEATVNDGDLEKLFCPVGGNETMQAVAKVLGIEVTEQEPKIAVLKCNGSWASAPKKVEFDGGVSCHSSHATFAGESGCPYGCLGFGDCAWVCNFDALYIDKTTGLPVVDQDKCTGCNACVNICPRGLFELRPKGKDNKRVYVACSNKEKGAPARKNCKVACIGCGKCAKIYETDSIKIENFLSYMDFNVDVENHGAELVACCPTKAIIATNMDSKQAES